MTPYYADSHMTLYGGDCREVMREMPEQSVHTVVTSPPYWGLRDYGVAGQLGLEPTPEEYVANMVAVFREVRRVLRSDGTLWLDLGDSYAHGVPGGTAGQWNNRKGGGGHTAEAVKGQKLTGGTMGFGAKVKDLVGIPWRVAFALQADGWYLRSDIIWSKPNPMPESVTDRPTKAHEYLFLLSKSPRYFYDADAVREPSTERPSGNAERFVAAGGERSRLNTHLGSSVPYEPNGSGRNLRSVWTIATEPYPGAHFATFPRRLVEPCVKAGTSERGVCPECGAPWAPIIERTTGRDWNAKKRGADRMVYGNGTGADMDMDMDMDRIANPPRKTGWRSACRHDADTVPATVLDPFAGSGTTLLVAQSLGRQGVGIDLSPEYLRQALARNAQAPLGLGA